jgi:IS5 family transposase
MMLRINYPQETLQRLDAIMAPLGLKMNVKLQAIDELLDDEQILWEVRQTAAQRYPKTTVTGRKGTPIVPLFRQLVIKHLYQWSFEETEQFVSESLVLRPALRDRLGLEPVCDDTTMIRYSALLTDALLKVINHRLVALASQKRVTKGRKLRVDTTCVETTIHYPTDSSLIEDSVRTVTCVLKTVKQLGLASEQLVRDMTRSVRNLTRRIRSVAQQKTQQQKEQFKASYQKLLVIARRNLATAKRVKRTLTNRAKAVGTDAVMKARVLKNRLDQVVPLFEQVITQTKRRVLEGEQVSNAEKIVSIHQPYPALAG